MVRSTVGLVGVGPHESGGTVRLYMKMTNGQKWQRVTLLRGLRKTLGEKETEELLRLELELSISQAKGRFVIPEKMQSFVVEVQEPNGRCTWRHTINAKLTDIRAALPSATINGTLVTVLVSHPLE